MGKIFNDINQVRDKQQVDRDKEGNYTEALDLYREDLESKFKYEAKFSRPAYCTKEKLKEWEQNMEEKKYFYRCMTTAIKYAYRYVDRPRTDKFWEENYTDFNDTIKSQTKEDREFVQKLMELVRDELNKRCKK